MTETEGKDRFAEMDALDEDQILAEAKGKVIEQYFYEIKDKDTGRVQPGISFSGTKWAARKMAEQGHPISVEHPEVMDTPDGTIRVLAMVKDLGTGAKLWGAYEQSKMMKVAKRDPTTGKKVEGQTEMVPNPNAFTLAVSKAQRNGIRHHLPEKVILQFYEEWKALKGSTALPAPSKEKPKSKDVTAESKVTEPPTPKRKVAYEEVEYALRDFAGSVDLAKGETPEIAATVKIENTEEYKEAYQGVRDALKEFKPKLTLDGSTALFTVKAEV